MMLLLLMIVVVVEVIVVYDDDLYYYHTDIMIWHRDDNIFSMLIRPDKRKIYKE